MGAALRRSVLLVCLALAVRAGAEDDGTRLVGPFTRADYPQAVIDRPLTLPAGTVGADPGGDFVSRRLETSLFGFAGADDWNLDLALRVGITDWLQAEAGTTFSLVHTTRASTGFEGVGALDLRPTLTSWQRVVPVRLSVLA